MQKEKQRHGCLTAYLIAMIVVALFGEFVYLFANKLFQQKIVIVSGWQLWVTMLLTIFDIICAIAIFKWKKWGFWGICLSAVLIMLVNFTVGVTIKQALSGLMGVAVLYGVLHIGKHNKGWPQLD